MLSVSNLAREVQSRTLFSDVQFELSQGGVALVRAPSGAGKTLLLRAISGLDRPNSGAAITLNGKNSEFYGFAGWRARVSYVFQGRVSLKGTIKEHFEKCRAFSAQRERLEKDQGTLEELQHLLNKVGLSSTSLEIQVDGENEEFVDRHWQDLSGGEYQRALLCCCIALRPEVLLLDEPTSACDPSSTRKVEQILLESHTTLVVVTHDAEQAERLQKAASDRSGGVLDVHLSSGEPEA